MPQQLFSFLLTLFLFVILGCSSTSKKTDISIAHYSTKLEIYSQALASSNCQQFKNLSEDKSFILANAAKVRSALTCKEKIDLSQIKDPYLKKLKKRAEASINESEPSTSITEKTKEASNIQPQDYLVTARDYLRSREFSKARVYFRKIITAKKGEFSYETVQAAFKGLRSSYKLEQKPEEHINIAAKYAAWTNKNRNLTDYQEAYVFWARALWTQGDADRASEILTVAEKKLRKAKSFNSLDEIYFILGKIQEEKGNFTQAIEKFAIGETYSKKSSPFYERLVWSKAWMSYKLGNFEQAAQQFAIMIENTKPGFDQNKYIFWQGISYKKNKQDELAKANFEYLRRNDPLGYYGMLAYREDKVPFPELQTTSENKFLARPESIELKTHELLNSLNFVGESALLQEVVALELAKLGERDEQGHSPWLYLFQSLAREKLYGYLFSEFASLKYEFRMKLAEIHPALLFPQEYRELAEVSGKKLNVNPEIIMALMRQESSFNPQARSPADAMGLMQIIPTVAEAHQKEAGVQFENLNDLYKPEINIPLGAAVLSGLKRKYNGQFVLMAASYNASDKAIQNWLDTRLNEDPLEFIEDIPYEETRGYVKTVLRNFVYYSRLSKSAKRSSASESTFDTSQSGTASLFPAWCLENLHNFKSSTL